ncbi:MAG: ATP-grasp domain-containing protein [Bacteroidetes bacterium]|nr:ATP-grasp domain-containing protein [Bacteroidota bacterium]
MKKNKDINILFLGGAKRISIAEKFIEAGKSHNKKVSIFSYELSKEVPISGIAQIIVGLKWNDIKVIEHLKSTIKKNNIHIVIPFVDPATVVAAKLKSELDSNLVFIPVPNEDECTIFFDKVKANSWFENSKIPVPPTLPRSSFPIIAKPRLGSASKGIQVLHSKIEYAKFISTTKKENFLFQKYIEATEYSVDCYVSPKTQKIISIVPRKRLEVSGGEVTKTITIKNTKIISISKNILLKSKLTGPITIQFLEELKTKNIVVMEINPRLGGGAPASIAAGANIPLYVLNDYLGIKTKPNNNWKKNLLMLRAYRETYIKVKKQQ